MEQYRVFGRTSYPEPLEYQETLTATDDDAAARAALERHGPRWVELVLIPERAIHWILGPQAPVPSPEGSGEPHEGPAARRSGSSPADEARDAPVDRQGSTDG